MQEAQAVGLPVVSTLHNGIPDGVLDGKTGFLVPEKDVDALAERCLLFLGEVLHTLANRTALDRRKVTHLLAQLTTLFGR